LPAPDAAPVPDLNRSYSAVTHDWDFMPHGTSQQECKATDLGLSPKKIHI